MALRILETAGTTVIRPTPGTLESVYFTGGANGSVHIYDAASATLPGTPVASFNITALDYASGRGLNIPMTNGIAVVCVAATRLSMIHYTSRP
jgi:hypothetical protein